MFRAFENIIDNAMAGLDDMMSGAENTTQTRSSRRPPSDQARTNRSSRSSRNAPFHTTHTSSTRHSSNRNNPSSVGFEARINEYIENSIEQALGPMEDTFDRLFDERPSTQSRHSNSRTNHSSRHHAAHNHARAQARAARSHPTNQQSTNQQSTNQQSGNISEF